MPLNIKIHSFRLKRLIPDGVPEDIKPTNEHGVLLVKFCKQAGFVILNGRVGDDAGVRHYTCITANEYEYEYCFTSLSA